MNVALGRALVVLFPLVTCHACFSPMEGYACVIGLGHHMGCNCYIRGRDYIIFLQVFNIMLYRVEKIFLN